MKKLFYFAVSGLAVLAACAYFYFSCLPVSTARLARLQRGMTTNEVEAVLGRPLEIKYLAISKGQTNADVLEKSLMWEYESFVHFWVVDVFFDQSGRFTSYWRD